MEQLNVIGIGSPFGYKRLELLRGDLMNIPDPADVIVISAFQDDYHPVPGTIIEALADIHDIDVAELRRTSPLDLTGALNFWLSRELEAGPAQRMLCLEMSGIYTDTETAAEHLFVALSILEAKRIPLETVALPLLGAGRQRVDPEAIMTSLLARIQPFLTRSEAVRHVQLVERDVERARLLSGGMDDVLQRPNVALPHGEVAESVRSAILRELDRAHPRADSDHQALLEDMRAVFSDPGARSYQIGVVARRFAEAVTRTLLPETVDGPLFRQIQALSEVGIAKWISSYLHVLRVFGNESAHESRSDDQRPPNVEDSDLVVCLVCTQRLLAFWSDQIGKESGSPRQTPPANP